jgi:hypothetical protein
MLGGVWFQARAAELGQPLALFAVVWIAYIANGDFLPIGDARPNVHAALRLARDGDSSFTPEQAPTLFRWRLRPGAALDPRTPIRSPQVAAAIRRGDLVVTRPVYNVIESRRAGHYLGIYGPGPAWLALPVFAALDAVTGDLLEPPERIWHASKWVASTLVAASVVFVFLAALCIGSRRDAWIAALLYGLGSGVWSSASQALWQQTPALFFVALGVLLRLRLERARGGALAAGCGLAWGLAVLCRPALALVAVPVVVHALARQRRVGAWLAAGAALGVAPLLVFQLYHLGSIFETGQGVAARRFAGSDGGPGIWRADPWRGVAGLLFSPSRGLLVYSPALALGLLGIAAAWRRPDLAVLRPLAVGWCLVLLLHGAFFRWWGGFCFGPRYLNDTLPILALLLVPLLPGILRTAAGRGLLAVLAAWSLAVQVVGAFAYDIRGWNDRAAVEVRGVRVLDPPPGGMRAVRRRFGDDARRVPLDIDRPENADRLWSLADSPLVYYAGHFRTARARKQNEQRAWVSRENADVARFLREPAPARGPRRPRGAPSARGSLR